MMAKVSDEVQKQEKYNPDPSVYLVYLSSLDTFLELVSSLASSSPA